MDQETILKDAVRDVAKLCALAAITAPKSGGQLFVKGARPFIETVIVEEKATLKQLADWLQGQGEKHREAIWFRDADTAEKLDLVLGGGRAGGGPPRGE